MSAVVELAMMTFGPNTDTFAWTGGEGNGLHVCLWPITLFSHPHTSSSAGGVAAEAGGDGRSVMLGEYRVKKLGRSVGAKELENN